MRRLHSVRGALTQKFIKRNKDDLEMKFWHLVGHDLYSFDLGTSIDKQQCIVTCFLVLRMLESHARNLFKSSFLSDNITRHNLSINHIYPKYFNKH